MSNSKLKTLKALKVSYVQYSQSIRTHNSFNLVEYSDLKFINDGLNSKKKVTEIPKNTPVYIGKNSLLPRFKLKEYFFVNKLKKTKMVLNAGAAIINRRSTSSILDKGNLTIGKGYYIPKDASPNILSVIGNKMKDFDGIIISNGDSYLKEMLNKFTVNINNYQPKEFIWMSDGWGNQKDFTEFENLYNIAYNKNCSLLYDEDVLEQINEQGHEIEKDSYDNLNAMLKSSDNENIKLAFEVLANSNYKESSLKVSMILANNWYKISSNRGHWNPNFRSLMMYFDETKINFKEGWKVLAQSLIKKYRNDPETLKEIKHYVLNNLQEETKKFDIGLNSITVDFYDRAAIPELN
jgi:hypothetical protein